MDVWPEQGKGGDGSYEGRGRARRLHAWAAWKRTLSSHIPSKP